MLSGQALKGSPGGKGPSGHSLPACHFAGALMDGWAVGDGTRAMHTSFLGPRESFRREGSQLCSEVPLRAIHKPLAWGFLPSPNELF